MKSNIKIKNSRIDTILVWGHGVKFLDDILLEIEENKNFEILKIIKHIPKSQKKLVKEVYSFDYAPFYHLKDKTKYLMKVDKEVCFIIIKNILPNEDLYGVGAFRHIESVSLKTFKESLRDKFNSYENGIRSHNHVIHATDNDTQTHYLLKYLGYKNGLVTFNNQKKIFNFPEHISEQTSLTLMKIDYENLICNVVAGDSWNSYELKAMEVRNSPHYQSLSNMDIYNEYWKKFIGGPIKDYNSPKKFEALKSDFKYLKEPYYNSYIIVKKHYDKYLIIDGLHRASLHFSQGNTSIIACLIN